MKKPQLKRLILVVVVILIFSSIIPAAAASSGRTKKRPIEDWLLANNQPDDMPLGGMPDWDKGLIIWSHLIDHTYAPLGYYKPPLTCSYDGFVLEKTLKDNKVLVTVNLHVTDAPFLVTYFAASIPSAVPVFRGTMQYFYRLQFTIDLDTLKPEDYDVNGNIIYRPWWWYVWVLFTLKSVTLLARGTGEFLTSYEGWNEGDTAQMNTFVSMVVVGPDYTGPNPTYNNNAGLFEISLVSMINFH
jgi:hypothetical protein